MARYLITGGAGFIGSHLVDSLLARGHRVRVLDDLSTGRIEKLHPDADLIVGDVADDRMVQYAMQGAAGCFHLAAVASVARCNEEWTATHRTNLGGTVAVFDAARRQGNVPVVYASSAAVYGHQDTLPIAESNPTAPRSSYGADKLGGEWQAKAGFVVHGLPSVGFRFFNVYGPRQDPRSPYSGVISMFADRLAAGQPVTIQGDGRQVRDFIHVSDIVRFLLAGMETVRHARQATVLNACTGEPTTIRTLADLIAGITASNGEILYGAERPGDIRASVGDPSAARRVLRVQAQTALATGLRDTLAAAAA